MKKLVHAVHRFNQTRRSFGLRSASLFLVDRMLAKLVRLDVQTIVWLPVDRVNAGPEQAPDYQFRFLTAGEVATFAKDPGNELTPEFADRVRRGRDFCFAALSKEGRLAAYGWYAVKEIEAEHCAGSALQLPEGVAYMYKGFTHPDFRGARLHAAGMGGALRALGARGVRALFSTVHWANFASLRSCDRLGYVTLGSIVSWRVFGSFHVRAPEPNDVNEVRIGPYCVMQPVRDPQPALVR
jgi:L-amino acid N-acyltransferase YncA